MAKLICFDLHACFEDAHFLIFLNTLRRGRARAPAGSLAVCCTFLLPAVGHSTNAPQLASHLVCSLCAGLVMADQRCQSPSGHAIVRRVLVCRTNNARATSPYRLLPSGGDHDSCWAVFQSTLTLEITGVWSAMPITLMFTS